MGGGAIGVCVALESARRGAKVTLLERGAELAWGCSAGNAGLISPSHAAPLATPSAVRQGLRWMTKPDSPFYIRPRPAVLPWLGRFVWASTTEKARVAGRVIRSLSSASLALHGELAASGVATGFDRRGVLYVYETERGLTEGRREALEATRAGLSCEVLDLAEARALEPALTAAAAGAVYYPGDAQCDPLQFVLGVGAAAAEAGATIQTRVEALGLRRREGRVDAVVTTAGEVTAGTYVIAAGAWSPQLVGDLGLYLPVEGGKGYHVDLAAADGGPRIPVWLQEARVIATPLEGRIRLAGTLELSGLDLSVDRRRVDAVLNAGRRCVAGLGGQVLEVWRGLRPLSPDGIPIVGRPESFDNVVLATGHGMMGLTLAPITGRLVGELIAGDESSHDLRPLRPDRFQPLFGRD